MHNPTHSTTPTPVASAPATLKRKRGRPKKGPVAALDASLIADLDPLLTDEHLAELIDVNPVTIERWRRAGTFPPALMLPGGHKRTRASEYHAWTAARAADAERHALQRRAIMAEVRSRQTRGPRPIQHRARRPGV